MNKKDKIILDYLKDQYDLTSIDMLLVVYLRIKYNKEYKEFKVKSEEYIKKINN